MRIQNGNAKISMLNINEVELIISQSWPSDNFIDPEQITRGNQIIDN